MWRQHDIALFENGGYGRTTREESARNALLRRSKTTSHKNYIGIEPDERWELKYEVTAENADTIRFSLTMRIVEGAVVVERTT
jgi:hypothetical protein